eukprot:SAG31_NODE_525_length_14489_cov_3.693815_14_plen_227_part_00
MAAIARLDDAHSAMVRSTIHITALAQVVEELLCNSIDSGATSIDVSFSTSKGFASVQDNGHGIGLSDLRKCGSRHSTSRAGWSSADQVRSCSSYFGFRGEAIASIARLGIVSIVTRCGGSQETHEKWMKDGKVLTVGPCSTPRTSSGTTVTVHELFHNVPVRWKQMVAESRRQALRIKQTVVRLALVHNNIRMSLYDSCSRSRLLSTQVSSWSRLLRNNVFELHAS